jgi:threonyl-tRNA synthetase
MIHAAIMGSIERFMAILIEHYAGAFPLWLSPVQAAILTLGEKHREFAGKINAELKSAGIRAELDSSDNVLSKKIKEQKLAKVPYLVVVGDKEMTSGKLTIEGRQGKLTNFTSDKFREMLLEEIRQKT